MKKICCNPPQKVWYLPFSPATFSHFYPILHSELLDIVFSLRSTTRPLDVISAMLLKEVSDSAPNTVSVINSSLQTSSVPSRFEHAVVHLMLYKANLDPSDLNNYRPIFIIDVFIKSI